MKNVFKIVFLSVITSVLLVFGCSDAIAATKAKTITIKSAKKVSKFISNYDQDFTIYATTGKKTVYSLNFDKKALKKKMKLTFNNNSDEGLLYLLENSYPNSKITGDTATDKYITQAAIWWYMDDTFQGTSVNPILKNENNEDDSYSLVSNYIKPLVQKAINAKYEGYKTKEATMKVNSANKALSLSKNKKYFESDYISVDLEGASKYTVSSNATILDENGKKKKTFNASETFKVRIPVDKISDNNKVSVTVKANGKEKVAKIFTPSDDKYTSVVGLYNKKHDLKETFDLTATISNTCKYIDGNYHDKSGNVTDENTYREVCGNVCKIVNENYYDTTGEETSKLIFEKECSNACKTKDETYYGIDSRKVDRATFEKECPVANAAVVKAEKEAKAKAEKEAKAKAEKEAKAKAEKEAKAKAEKEAKAKAEKEAKAKAEKEAKAKAEKKETITSKTNTENKAVVNPEAEVEVAVPNTNAEIPFSNILFGTLLVLMGFGILYKRNKSLN